MKFEFNEYHNSKVADEDLLDDMKNVIIKNNLFNRIQQGLWYLAHTSPETAQILICFRLSGTFAMTG